MKRLLLLWLLLLASPVCAQSTLTGALLTGKAPAATFGKEGDYFFDAAAYQVWGPKTSGSWGNAAAYSVTLSGVAFATSATVDATNSTNHTTGTEPIGRLANVSAIVYRVAAVNFNAGTTDTTVPITLPTGATRYVVSSVRITNASASLSTATIGVFTAAGGTGQTIAANQAITVTATATDTVNNTMQLTLTNAATMAYNDASVFVRIGTAQGSAATGDVVITLNPL